MATKEKKGQKFGRKRDRSPAHKNYNYGRKDLVNKVRKMKKHVKNHPNDKRNASALLTVSKGGLSGAQGPVPTFPVKPYVKSSIKIEGLNDLDFDFRKHKVERVDGKKKVILEELVASRTIYCVEGSGVTQDRAIVLEEAEGSFNASHGACVLLERTGNLVKVLKNKRATPPKGYISQLYMKAFAG